MTTENNSERAPVSSASAATETRKFINVNSLLFGAYAAAAVLAVYSLIQLVGEVFTSILPYVAGGALFISLSAIFLSIIGMLKKMRKGARKNIATMDTYMAIAVLTVVGYFAAACVATFQPGAHAAELWTNGAAAAILWACLFGGGKYAAELFRDGGKN